MNRNLALFATTAFGALASGAALADPGLAGHVHAARFGLDAFQGGVVLTLALAAALAVDFLAARRRGAH